MNTKRKNTIIMAGAIFDSQFFPSGLKFLRSREFNTTETDESAMDNQASSGFNISHIAENTQAAIGIHITL